MNEELIKSVIDGRPPCLADQFTEAVGTLISPDSFKNDKTKAVHTLAELSNATINEPEGDEQEIEFSDYSFILIDPLEGEEEAEDEGKAA